MNEAERKAKFELLARTLSGYDEATWRRLRHTRRNTYRRAVHTLLLEWTRIEILIRELTSEGEPSNETRPDRL